MQAVNSPLSANLSDAFESTRAKNLNRKLITFNISIVSTKNLQLTAYESQYRRPFRIYQQIKIAISDAVECAPLLHIEILIGRDRHWNTVKERQPICLSSHVALLPSVFGWILNGKTTGVTVNGPSSVNVVNSTAIEIDTQQFWDLELLGIKKE